MSDDRVVDLTVEKPAAGGRMLARLDGQVVLVAGAIPGERVRARLEARRRGALFATTTTVVEPSPDRRPAGQDPACGGRHYAHIAPERQRALKAEIVADAFRRLARLDLPAPPRVHGSPEDGYRMRARLHAHGPRIGFYREGTHALCDPGCTRQLRPDTLEALGELSAALAAAGVAGRGTVDLVENRPATERALLVDLADPVRQADLAALLQVAGATGVGLARGGRPVADRGTPTVTEAIALDGPEGSGAELRLRHHVAGFFQGNRYLLQALVDRVLAHVPAGPLADLFAGAGLFGLAHACLGRGPVVAVEGDEIGAADLLANAEPFGDAVRVEAQPVETVLGRQARLEGWTVVVDPPRTGLSPDTTSGLVRCRPSRVVYVSCDPATLARDVGRLAASGYSLIGVEIFDLFPGTAHVETLAILDSVLAGREPVESDRVRPQWV